MSLYNSSLTTILYTIPMVVCHGSNYLTTSPVVVPNGSSSCDFLTWALWFHSILAMPGSLSLLVLSDRSGCHVWLWG